MRLTNCASDSTWVARAEHSDATDERRTRMHRPSGEARPWPDEPLVVAYGLGVDSTAMLVEFAHRGIRPDLILFADTGGEKPETCQYLDVIRPFLARHGFPDVITVRYRPRRAVYSTLEAQCLHTGTLPSL